MVNEDFIPHAAVSQPEHWVMSMEFQDLLFMHWPLPPEQLTLLLPPGLTLDTFDGHGWLAVVPFKTGHLHPRGLPSLPGVSNFLELNVRTYVKCGGLSGVYFFSLDASSRLAVRSARWFFDLPYYNAEMTLRKTAEEIAFSSRRTHKGSVQAQLKLRYAPTGPVFHAAAGTVEHWLTQRFSLFVADKRGEPGEILRGDLQHHPWPLQAARAELELNQMTDQLAIQLPGAPALVHFSKGVEARAWSPIVVRPAKSALAK
jgi:uncharacterized protein